MVLPTKCPNEKFNDDDNAYMYVCHPPDTQV